MSKIKGVKEKVKPKDWEDRVLGALHTLDNAANKQEYDANHTKDGKKIKVGLKVYALDDPTILWKIYDIEKQTYRRRVILEAKDKVNLKISTTKVFFNQKKAVVACIKDIKQAEKIILRNMRENLSRLDAKNRVKQLEQLKKDLK